MMVTDPGNDEVPVGTAICVGELKSGWMKNVPKRGRIS
jgi:hypothetical protein